MSCYFFPVRFFSLISNYTAGVPGDAVCRLYQPFIGSMENARIIPRLTEDISIRV